MVSKFMNSIKFSNVLTLWCNVESWTNMRVLLLFSFAYLHVDTVVRASLEQLVKLICNVILQTLTQQC